MVSNKLDLLEATCFIVAQIQDNKLGLHWLKRNRIVRLYSFYTPFIWGPKMQYLLRFHASMWTILNNFICCVLERRRHDTQHNNIRHNDTQHYDRVLLYRASIMPVSVSCLIYWYAECHYAESH